MEDVNGIDIRVGDRVAFATRQGDHAHIKVGVVEALRPAAKPRDDKIVIRVPEQEKSSIVNVRSYLGPKVVVL